MHILTAPELREIDQRTIKDRGISSLDLMEEAATAFTTAFTLHFPDTANPVCILVGRGNNGGDGLVTARHLHQQGYQVQALLIGSGEGSPDYQANLQRASKLALNITEVSNTSALDNIVRESVVIDSLFGTGLTHPIEGLPAEVINHVNRLPVTRVALDIPSGLFADQPSTGVIFSAHYTFTLGYPKPGLFATENAEFVGELATVEFPLADPAHIVHQKEKSYLPSTLLHRSAMVAQVKRRGAQDHKGTFGHALLVAGSFGMMGAAVISSRAVLRSGAGLVSCHIPRCGYEIMQVSFPEAMCKVDAHRYHTTEIGSVDRYESVGIGPGIGTKELTAKALRRLLQSYNRPMVIDADALNIIASHPDLLDLIPEGSILTPHPKEFGRLFGETDNSFARWQVQYEVAQNRGINLVLKSGYTSIASPNGTIYINPTGNPGMGTAGTGDALTGLLTGLLAQSYEPSLAAKLGVFLHGLAGDIAAQELGQQFLLAEDVVSHIGKAYQNLAKYSP